MKKQLIAKLLVLCMVLAMLPISALAAQFTVGTNDEGTYVIRDENDNSVATWNEDMQAYVSEDGTIYDYDENAGDYVIRDDGGSNLPGNDDDYTYVPSTTPTTTTTTTTATPDVVAEDGVVTATVSGGKVSDAVVDALVEQAQAGDEVAIAAKGTNSVSVSAAKLAEIIEKTGNAVSVGNSVAAVKVNSALVELAGGADVKVAPVKNADGTISVPVTAGGKTIAPEDVPGGIDVEIPGEYAEDSVEAVNAVKADKTEVELTFSINVGKLQINLTVTGNIRITSK